MGCGGSKSTDASNATHLPANQAPARPAVAATTTVAPAIPSVKVEPKPNTTAPNKGISLHYFNLRGRGEPIRLLLAHKGIKYEDRRIDFENWPALKSTYEFGTLPCLEIEGKKLQTSAAILRYLAQKNGLYPTDKYDVYLSESLIDLLTDLASYCGKLILFDRNPRGVDEWLTNDGLKRLKIVENRLIKNQGGKGYFIGNSVSYVDFVVLSFVQSYYFQSGLEYRTAKLAEELPVLKAYVDRFLKASPGITNYLNSRPKALA